MIGIFNAFRCSTLESRGKGWSPSVEDFSEIIKSLSSENKIVNHCRGNLKNGNLLFLIVWLYVNSIFLNTYLLISLFIADDDGPSNQIEWADRIIKNLFMNHDAQRVNKEKLIMKTELWVKSEPLTVSFSYYVDIYLMSSKNGMSTARRLADLHSPGWTWSWRPKNVLEDQDQELIWTCESWWIEQCLEYSKKKWIFIDLNDLLHLQILGLIAQKLNSFH